MTYHSWENINILVRMAREGSLEKLTWTKGKIVADEVREAIGTQDLEVLPRTWMFALCDKGIAIVF